MYNLHMARLALWMTHWQPEQYLLASNWLIMILTVDMSALG